jgi:hypothetical protein
VCVCVCVCVEWSGLKVLSSLITCRIIQRVLESVVHECEPLACLLTLNDIVLPCSSLQSFPSDHKAQPSFSSSGGFRILYAPSGTVFAKLSSRGNKVSLLKFATYFLICYRKFSSASTQ